ncbi:unnamed protein product [Closterium sp. NIES-65]|nr:unnamed protein product [Closterium sp. NIES-65]
MSQSLELNQRHHVMHLLPEVECGPEAWTVLKELHAPTSVVATLMLERELSALRLSEGEPVQPVLDKLRDLYAKLATAGITYSEQTKCLKMLSLLPESWLQFTSGLSLPQNQSSWRLEWNRHQDGGARRNQKNGASIVADSSDNNPKSNGSAEKKKERTAGQFFHIREQGEQGEQENASAKVGAELHPLDYWVLDIGAAWTMTCWTTYALHRSTRCAPPLETR